MPQSCANKAIISLSFRVVYQKLYNASLWPLLLLPAFLLLPVPSFLFVSQITALSVPTWKEAPLTMLYMCAKLGQGRAIRGNVRQLYMSAYITLTVTQTTSMRSKQWSNILVHGCQNRRPSVCFSLPSYVMPPHIVSVCMKEQEEELPLG